MNTASEISRGTKAKAILEDSLFKEAVEKVQAGIIDDFSACDPLNKDELQVIRIRLKALADITRQLASVMNTGRLAEAQQEQSRGIAAKTAERVKRGFRSVF